jgi:hypothetical protein
MQNTIVITIITTTTTTTDKSPTILNRTIIFCGCGAAAHLGIADRSLWLAASWYKFPRSHPAPNTVAVRRHHVFVLKEDRGGGLWLVADYNSGGHLSRLHVRSLSGYTIVQPSYGNWGSQWSGYL